MILIPGRIQKEIGQRFRAIRLLRGWTAEELAERAGVNKRTPLRLEQGENVTFENMLRIANVLGALEGFSHIAEEALTPESVRDVFTINRVRAPRRGRRAKS